jgi:ABC-2 type transport system ATP-binding protein
MSDAEAPAITVTALRKRFDARPVLDGVTFEVRPGEILGYVGPNGAGKSTTIKILLGLMPDFQGEVRIAGHDPRRAPLEVKRVVGYVAENAVIYDPLTVAEFLLFVGRIHGLRDPVIEQRAMGCLSALELDDRADSRIGELSKGMRQKVLLTAALLHAPAVLLLDEPLSGLDVSSQLLVKAIVRRLAESGRAILFSSHVMDVVERLCTRIAILSDGRIVAQGTFDELAATEHGGSLEGIFAHLTGDDDVGARAERVVAAITS